jgi:hypothetical protein
MLAGGTPFRLYSSFALRDRGCPVLAFFARAGTMLPTPFLFLRHKPAALCVAVPALRKVREGRGTHCIGEASEIKSLGHPP